MDRPDDMASIDHHWEGLDVLVVKIAGEIDMSNVDKVWNSINAVKTGADLVIFDLAALEFIDSMGLAVLLRVAANVGRVQLRSPSPIVSRAVQAVGLDELLPTEQLP